MNKNRIRGLQWRAKRPMTTKPISIKLTGSKSGGCASKAVELTSEPLKSVSQSRGALQIVPPIPINEILMST
jgi:hypothetical protein